MDLVLQVFSFQTLFSQLEKVVLFMSLSQNVLPASIGPGYFILDG